ncbi:MAG: DUF1540 domain-containing protein [Clostridia bacterium]|nr:DUF1540 domain-containing protein [Clostridia bacterium]
MNKGIKCEVTNCRYNLQGTNCKLDSITVTCGCGEQCTCCGSYDEK